MLFIMIDYSFNAIFFFLQVWAEKMKIEMSYFA